MKRYTERIPKALIPVAGIYGFISPPGIVRVFLFHAAFALPYATFLFRNFFIGIPHELLESARMDGANDARIFRRGYWGGYHIPRHFYLFDASTLSRLLVEQGFEVVSVRSILSPAFWVYSVHNALADSPRLRRLARWFHAQSPLPMAVAAAIDVVQIATRRQSTNLQLLARKR